MNDPSLEARIERLERLVEELHQAMASTSTSATVPAGQPIAPAPAASAAPEPIPPGSTRGAAWREWIWDSELWLNKLGIGLVLFGVTFLFKYSIDQGWLTPLVRVGFGAVVGLVLLLAGLRLGERQRSFAQVLLGGGIAIFYIVGFAAFQLYELVGYDAAFVYMVGVTLAAFTLAVREDHSVLSLIGVKGALGTPFLLYHGDGNFHWLVGYTCLVAAAAVALFLLRGWRSVLWTAVLGGWAVLLVAYLNQLADLPVGLAADRWTLQGAVLFCWVAFGVLPAVWESRWGALAAPQHSASLLRSGALRPQALRLHLHLLTISTPLVALGFVSLIWPSLHSTSWGWLSISAAAVYAGVGAGLWQRKRELAAAHLLAAALLLPMGTLAALSGEQLYVALAAEAALLHLVASRLGMRSTAIVAHALFASCAVWFLTRLDSAAIPGTTRSLADLAVLALGFAASMQVKTRHDARVYLFALHAALLGWFWRELVVLPNGAAYVSAAWGTYGLALLVLGLRWRIELLQRTALATLLLMVAKLFLVDLAALEALWRILLFLSLGGLFLLISYFLQGLWRERPSIAGR